MGKIINEKLLLITIATLILTIFAVAPSMASGEILKVPEDYPTIQAAIDAASEGDTVLVAPGTYDESITMKSGVTVQGSGADVTTIRGDGSYYSGPGPDIYRTYTILGVRDSIITGFTITGSYYGIHNARSSPTIENNKITDNGIGIRNHDYSSPMIQNNVIKGNVAYGIYNSYSSPKIKNNKITDNGIGIRNHQIGFSRIKNNVITDNAVGISTYYSYPQIESNVIAGNKYSGIYNFFSVSPPRPGKRFARITNNVIVGNGHNGIRNGLFSSLVITNNVIVGNGYDGIFNSRSSPPITNNVIIGNKYYGIHNFDSSPTITFNNLWANSTDIYNEGHSSPTVENNIHADPLFVDPAQGDYHLQFDSPCIDAGTNDTLGLPMTDFEGDPRVWDGDGDGLAVVDMGADEYYMRVIAATIDIDPDTLNLKSKGKWITAYIELPEGYNVEDVYCPTILLEGVIPAASCDRPLESVVGDYDDDGIPDLMVKFDRETVQGILDVGDEVELTVTGELYDGTSFEGSDVIRVIDKGSNGGGDSNPTAKGKK